MPAPRAKPYGLNVYGLTCERLMQQRSKTYVFCLINEYGNKYNEDIVFCII